MGPAEDPTVHSDASEDSDEDTTPSSAKRARSSRACVACRRMKTRCEFDEALGNACKLCIRARRQCVMQSLPRRRRPKTTDRVADLERKIDALTALLSNKESTKSTEASPTAADTRNASQHQLSPSTQAPSALDTLIADVLNRGILDWSTACLAFDQYNQKMCHFFPFIVFPATSTADIVKQQQPLLFFAIVTVALRLTQSNMATELIDMLAKDLSLRIMYNGERSLELVQTLLMYTLYYSKPKYARELNFNQIVHIASTMSLDLGLGRRSHKDSSAQTQDLNQLESLAGRRAWLGCYYLATSASISLRHPAFVRWSVYIEECLNVLSSEPQALPSDAWLCDLIRLQHIAEDASVVFAMDDPGSFVTLNDPQTRYQVGSFRQRLEHWHRYCETSLQRKILSYVRHTEAIVSLYIHESALHSEHHNIDDFRLPLTGAGSEAAVQDMTSSWENLQFPAARIESLFACLAAIHACFDAMLSMDLATVCALPNMFFVRTGYAAWALRKLSTICESQAQANGQFSLDTKDLKFEEYLSSFIELLAKVHAETGSQVVRAFYIVMTQIKAHAAAGKAGVNEFPPRCPERPASSHLKPVDSASQQLDPTIPVDAEPVILPPQSQLDGRTPYFLQQGMPSWAQGGFDDSVMSSLEALQWLDQDFVFEDNPMYGPGGIN
ncbi:hypothetical protein A1O3_04122 [Capronia epimyces CBS 606.96]|uniref:Zn(2)-C6 fungal-type domain-containing protein n=1 Tax=Capronia epimyces CBS 606.96 TaxID=1182542 RepID=W9Y3S4_9EURO|nr:uncharacterized protein A1O3_04122 [Capronia epimyces CBS 606.96]EXJ87163.1 hypothetical protein A1O3_04122 [Capronia epimyces CBS 606.96]